MRSYGLLPPERRPTLDVGAAANRDIYREDADDGWSRADTREAKDMAKRACLRAGW